jgi:hypothetical protein
LRRLFTCLTRRIPQKVECGFEGTHIFRPRGALQKLSNDMASRELGSCGHRAILARPREPDGWGRLLHAQKEREIGGSKVGNYEKAMGCCRTSASRSRRSTGCPRRSAACRSRSASYERVKLDILPAGRYASLMTI